MLIEPSASQAGLTYGGSFGSIAPFRAHRERGSFAPTTGPGWGSPTQAEQRRMGEALAWPVEYLAAIPDLEGPLFVNLGGMSKATGVKIVAVCRDLGVWSAVFYKKRRTGLEIITAGPDGQRPGADVMPSE